MMNTTLLLLDRDLHHRQGIEEALRPSYSVIPAQSSHDLSSHLEDGYPHMFILDLSPELLPFLEQLRADPVGKWIPILFLASSDQFQEPRYQRILEQHDYVLKPAVPFDLLMRVKKRLQQNTYDILLLDPSAEDAHRCQQVLTQHNYSVLVAATAQEALQLNKLFSFKFIVIDSLSTAQEAPQIVESIRQEDHAFETPLLFLTTLHQHSEIQRDLIAKGNDYVVKPVEEFDLVTRLQKLSPIQAHRALHISLSGSMHSELPQWLSAMNIKLIPCPNPDSLIEHLQQEHYDFILWDTEQLPQDPMAMLSQIRLTQERIPIIFLSATNDLHLHSALILKGEDYVTKPLSQEKLGLRLQKLLNTLSSSKIEEPPATEPSDALHTSPPVSETPLPLPPIERDVDSLPTVESYTIQDNPDITLLPSSAHMSQQEKDVLMEQIKVGLNHEIRNPLTSILIGTQALSRRYDEGSDEKQIANEIEKAAKRIKNILNAMGNLEKYIIEDYVGGIKMLSFTESKHD